MKTANLFPSATGAVAETIRGIDRLELSAPTPCAGWDAAKLINHFTGTVESLGRIGRGEPLDPDNPWGQGKDVASGEWTRRLVDDLDRLGATWTDDQAWTGSVSFGSSEMTAKQIGEMAFGEALLHGWDLTRAANHPLAVSEEVGEELLRFVTETAELGRSMGAYGPEVTVAEDRPSFDRALGLSGRDPDWQHDHSA